MFLIFILYSLFASVFPLQKAALAYSEPLFLISVRMLIAGVLLTAYQLFIKKEKIVFQKKIMLRLFGLAFINIFLTNFLEVWGLKYLTSGKSCFMYSLAPFFSALFCYFLYNEQMSHKKWLGLTIGFLGYIPILMSHTSAEETFGSFFIFSLPELAGLGAAVGSVYGWILLKQSIQEDHLSPMLANGLSMLLGGALSLTASFSSETWSPSPVTEWLPFSYYSLALLLISNLIAYNFYGYLLKKFSATFLSFAGFITPFLAAFFGWYFLGETISWPFYLSGAVVFCGLILFYQEELKTEAERLPAAA